MPIQHKQHVPLFRRLCWIDFSALSVVTEPEMFCKAQM